MKDLSSDLLLLLVFALVLLFQFVLPLFRKSKQQEGVPVEPARALPQQLPETDWAWKVPPASPAAPLVMPPVAAPLHRYAESRDVQPTRGRRRFSRESLMGNRHKLRDAVVIAAILGPCRAVEPHDIQR